MAFVIAGRANRANGEWPFRESDLRATPKMFRRETGTRAVVALAQVVSQARCATSLEVLIVAREHHRAARAGMVQAIDYNGPAAV